MSDFHAAIIHGVVPCMGIAVLLTIYRLLRGPTLADRVVATDLLATLGIGLMAIYSVLTDEQVYLDVAMVLALISFLGTVGFAYYIQNRAIWQKSQRIARSSRETES